MKSIRPIIAIALVILIANSAVAAPSTEPQLLILYRDDVDAEFMAEVKRRIEAQTAELDLKTGVTVTQTPAAHRPGIDWRARVRSAQKPFGTVAIMGLSCGRKRCELVVFPAQGDYSAKIVIRKPATNPEARIVAVTATIREALLGPLLPELKRLDQEGRTPSPTPSLPDGVLIQSPFEAKRKAATPVRRPWLWISAGYHGDHPHPGGHPIHGPFVGVDLMPTHLLGLGLSVGWLGMRRAAVDGASATIQRLDTTFALRLLFPLGPAKISVSALGRLDAAFVDMNHQGGHKDENDARFEVEIGGITMWHLPLPKKLNAWVGAGVLVALRSREVEVYVSSNATEIAMDAATVRMIWCAGVAFSPILK